ncbi:MAG: hypothetical protein ACYDBB_05870 [Armatimonadota bacterium]
MRNYILCLLAIVLTYTFAQQAIALGLTRVERDGKISLADYGYRDWDPELLHYAVDARVFKPGKVVLRDAAGVEVPCQIDGGTLSFVAGLKKSEQLTYTLTAGKPDPRRSTLQVKKAGNLLEIGNEFFTLRVPAVGTKTLKTPVPAASVLAPFQGWQPAGGPWMGASRFITERQVSGYSMMLLKSGPACVEYEARYQLVPRGEYVCRIAVSHGLERADITEEFDFNAITTGQDFLVLELQKGWNPSAIGIVKNTGEAKGAGVKRMPLADYLAPKLKDGTNPPAPVGGSGETPMPPKPEANMMLLEKITAAGRWGNLIGGIELRGEPAATRLAVIPMHTGSWRRAMALTTWHQQNTGVVVALPISVRHITWYNEVTDDISPFSTHEHDEGLRESYGRRQWALTFNATPEILQERAGYIGLDTYKEWTLAWSEKASPADYPRAWYTKAGIERLKKTLAQHPDRELLSKYYVFSGKTDDAVAHAKQAMNGILGEMGYLGNWYVAGLSHYRQSQGFAQHAQFADDALACPDLPADLRRDLRRTLAFAAYMMAEPDLNPRGVGVHLGNNNMSINRTCTLAFFAGLLPDHPLYKYWMGEVTDFVNYKFTTHFAEDGTNLECPTYQLYGPLRFLDDAVTIIHNTGGPDFAPYVAANVRYLANLTMPDARLDGRRIIPGMGNSSNILESIFGITLNTVERADPKLAAQMQMIHKSNYPIEPVAGILYNHRGQVFRYLPDIPQQNAALTTTIMPTYGVVFRAHFGSPDETGMLFRTGINWGHWDSDPLNTVLYGKGAPLSPGTGYQYYGGAGTDNNVIYHNQVKVGAYHQQEIFGRVDSAIQDYGFGPNADYAVASRYYPPEAFTDKKGEMSWNRHILFLKSAKPEGANYFVLRDTFPGGEGRPTWWTWMNLDGAEKISVDGTAFDPAKTPYNTQVPDEQMPTVTGNSIEMKTAYGAGTAFRFSEPLKIRLRMTWDYGQGGRLGMKKESFPKLAGKEVKTTVEAMTAPGKDYFYLVYPHKDAEAVPACTKLADGVMKITTTESTDYAFISDTPLAVDTEGVTFTGKAGSVRLFPDRVVFCLNSGTGRIGYKGHIFEGAGPFERTVKLGDLKAGVSAVNDTNEKKRQRAETGGITVDGEGPFQAKLDGQTIRMTVDGRARVLYISRPEWIWRPQYAIDGKEWMACWTDYPSSGWGTFKNTNLMAISVPDGKHELVITNQTFPTVWERKFTPMIPGAIK